MTHDLTLERHVSDASDMLGHVKNDSVNPAGLSTSMLRLEVDDLSFPHWETVAIMWVEGAETRINPRDGYSPQDQIHQLNIWG